jgi:YegS/Rv2252/BmrU family lipid kinase
MTRYKIILNPAAGHGNGKLALPRVKECLDQLHLDYDLTVTDRAGQTTGLARQSAEEGYDVVVAAGGDGTINEVANGLMAFKLAGHQPPALGILPVGRGNDFAHSLSLPIEVDKACQALADNRRRPIDIGKVTGGKVPEGLYFCNCVGIGFDAVVTIEVVKLPRWGGFASFMYAVIKTIFLYTRPPLADINIDGEVITQRSLMISIMNGRQLGSGAFITAPDSKPDDGLLDICIAAQMNLLQILHIMPLFFKGTQVNEKTIKMRRGVHITVTARDGSLAAHTDGEMISFDDKSLAVELLPRQLDLIY